MDDTKFKMSYDDHIEFLLNNDIGPPEPTTNIKLIICKIQVE